MKKVMLGMLALSLMSAPAAFASGGKKKAKKAKSECKKNCCDKKDCQKTASCVPMPGCC